VISSEEFSDGVTYMLSASAVSPDGQRVAFQRFGQRVQIYMSSLAGSAPVPLTANNLGREDAPSWSPAGQWVAFARGGDVFKSRSDGGDDGVLIGHGCTGAQDGFRWSPVGESLAFMTEDGLVEVSSRGLAELDTRSDIYLLEGLRPQPAGWLAAIGERFGR